LNNPKLFINAHYMLGWSYYKQYQYEKSLESYALVLSHHLAGVADVEKLDKTVKPIVDDTLHSISLSLDKAGGADYISQVPNLAKQGYVWMIYKNLGDYYLEKELYGESVASYRSFVNQHAQSEKAPGMHNQLIGALVKGGFPEQALEEKARFVSAYGLYSNYSGKTANNSGEINSSLRSYLGELASYFHSKGQAHTAAVADFQEKIVLNADKNTRVFETKLASESVE